MTASTKTTKLPRKGIHATFMAWLWFAFAIAMLIWGGDDTEGTMYFLAALVLSGVWFAASEVIDEVRKLR